MLGAMRRRSRSFMVWVLFGFLIAVFVVGFGTPASNKLACGNTTAVGKVGDHEINKEDYQFAFRLIMREGVPATAKAYMLDMLLRPHPSPLVLAAKRSRAKVVASGMDMWVAQGRAQLRRWTGLAPDETWLSARVDALLRS